MTDPATSAEAPLSIGRVVLTVRDLPTVTAFYEQALGLHVFGHDGTVAHLGAGATVLLELRQDAHARIRSPREAGLFHTAFLLPARADLGRWTRHAAERRVPIQGTADHAVSEAIYLGDPEGNGVEIYADRPRAMWRYAPDGMLVMVSDPLDTTDLMESGGAKPWAGFPDGATVGHVHLQVGAIAPADAFYGGVLGLDVTCRYPGASFFGSGGYHHHLAANIWNSRNASVRTEPTTGLDVVEIVARDAATHAAVAARIALGWMAAADASSPITIRDPWGTALTLVAKES